MDICEECLLNGHCDGCCAEVDDGVDEYFAKQNDEYDYACAENESNWI